MRRTLFVCAATALLAGSAMAQSSDPDRRGADTTFQQGSGIMNPQSTDTTFQQRNENTFQQRNENKYQQNNQNSFGQRDENRQGIGSRKQRGTESTYPQGSGSVNPQGSRTRSNNNDDGDNNGTLPGTASPLASILLSGLASLGAGSWLSRRNQK